MSLPSGDSRSEMCREGLPGASCQECFLVEPLILAAAGWYGIEAGSLQDGRSAGAQSPRGSCWGGGWPGRGPGRARSRGEQPLGPLGLSYQLWALLPNGGAGAICTTGPSTFRLPQPLSSSPSWAQ